VNRDIQKHLYQALISVFNSAGVKRGAAVVQDPRTGAVLGLVSMPSFDGNVFENSSEAVNFSKINNILSNKDKPLLNRVISGRYSPGSTIKPLLALAGLKEGVVTPSTTINATGSIKVQSEVDPGVFYTFRDWRVHGWTDIKKAIADSVDVFFYALGGGYGDISGLGIDKIESYLKNFLVDRRLGIDLPGEMAGFTPSREWKKEAKGEPWYIGDTYNISIGQGDLLVTPLWLNTYIGSIANGGKLMKPFVVREIKNPVDGTSSRLSPQVLGEIPFEQETINIVRQGMRQAVVSGTATLLNNLPVPVAAKTGTAQVTGRGLNSLFTVFGPYDEPEIVMTVLVENINQSQGLAIRVANEFLMWYFSESFKNRN
jgi:penicillin-binding protein 2